MPKPSTQARIRERSIMALLLVLLLFLSPMSDFWAALDAPWYSPYIAWALAIFIAWWLQRYIARELKRR